MGLSQQEPKTLRGIGGIKILALPPSTFSSVQTSFTCSLQSIEIKTFIEIPFIVPSFTIHTQSTEQAVHQVTEAASAVAGQECRDGFVRARIQHRKIIPRFTTKKQIMTIFENK